MNTEDERGKNKLNTNTTCRRELGTGANGLDGGGSIVRISAFLLVKHRYRSNVLSSKILAISAYVFPTELVPVGFFSLSVGAQQEKLSYTHCYMADA